MAKQSDANQPRRGVRSSGSPETSRRGFLKSGAALTAAAGGALIPQGAAAQGANVPPQIPEWMKLQGAPILSPPYGQPSEFEKHVVRRYSEVRVTDTAATTF